MGNQGHITVARSDGGHSVGDVDDEGRTADVGTIRKIWLNTQVLSSGQGRKTRSEQPVDVILGDTGVLQGVVGCFRTVARFAPGRQ